MVSIKKFTKLKSLSFQGVEIIYIRQVLIVLMAVSKLWICTCNNESKGATQACSSVLVWKFETVLPQHGQMLVLCPEEHMHIDFV